MRHFCQIRDVSLMPMHPASSPARMEAQHKTHHRPSSLQKSRPRSLRINSHIIPTYSHSYSTPRSHNPNPPPHPSSTQAFSLLPKQACQSLVMPAKLQAKHKKESSQAFSPALAAVSLISSQEQRKTECLRNQQKGEGPKDRAKINEIRKENGAAHSSC